MQNAEQLENAYDTLKSSAGSAEKEQESYISSLSGKINALKESLTAISMQMIDSDMFKGLIDGATTGVQATSKLIDFFGTFPSIVGIATASLIAFNSRIRENTNSMLQMIPGYGKATTSLKRWSESISKNITQLQEQKASLKKAQADALAAGENTTALGKKMLGLNTNLGVLKVGLAATKVAVVALNAAMSMALTMGISAIISGLGSLIDKLILTRSELNELNQEFITTNSDSEMSNVIDLVNTYEELENKLSTLKKGTSEYKEVEDKLASTQESIISIYPSASKAIENNTEAKRLNLEATKKLIDKDLELAKSDALNILEKNDTKTDTGLDKAIEEYEEYYKVLEKVNDLAEKEEAKSVNIESKLSDSGELLVNAKDVDVYKKRVESLNDTLEASYEAYKILGVSNDKYAEKAKKVGEALGYSASQTEELINKLKETDESADETAEALEDINGDGIIDATDQMLKLAMATDEAKSAVENLADSFSGLQDGIELLKQMKEEYSEYGMLDTDTMTKVLNSGDNQLIALLGDEANFIENINSLLDEKSKAQDEVLKTAIAMAQAEVNGSQEVVDATNSEKVALENLMNAKNNATSNSAQQRVNQESILVSKNAENYNIDQSNYNNKENYKIKGSFDSANARISNEKAVTDGSAKNYSIDDKNHVLLTNSKIDANDSYTNVAIANAKTTTDQLNENYKKDAKNYSEYINSIIENIRARARAESALTGGSLGFKNESAEVMAKYQEYLKLLKEAENASKTVSSYVGSGGVSSTVGHGNVGSGSSSGGSSSSSNKDVSNIKETVEWYWQLNNAIEDYNNLLTKNKNAQEKASGTDLIKLLKEEISLTERQIFNKNQLIQAYQSETKNVKGYLQYMGLQIDANNNLIGVSEKVLKMKQEANKLSGTAKENAIAEVEKVEEYIERFLELTNNLIPSLENDINDLNSSIREVYQTQVDLVADMEKEIYDVVEYYEGKKKDAKLSAIKEQRKALEDLYDLEDREDDLAEKQNSLADIKNQMDLYENAQDSVGKAKYQELKSQYDELLKELNTTIRDNRKEDSLADLDNMEESIEKEYEDALSPENINKIISDAMSSGYIKLGDEVLDLNSATTQYLAETTVGTQNLINANTELLNSYLSVKDILKDISTLNANLGNIGIDLNTVYSGMSRSNTGNSVSFGDITVQIQGSTNMSQADIETAVQKAIINVSNNLKF
ncbi:hypothetical protein [Clostridium cuniculi]|uniref:hypothetical protein n=1 Tax=Clostridium cuniculi TaxID=2548455 RepID=UPI001054DA00|nr:hypothetical protein [Clostridium cuniculi]